VGDTASEGQVVILLAKVKTRILRLVLTDKTKAIILKRGRERVTGTWVPQFSKTDWTCSAFLDVWKKSKSFAEFRKRSNGYGSRLSIASNA